jgi:Protein of unknown function (DUF2914)/Tetratricopeptide repeat
MTDVLGSASLIDAAQEAIAVGDYRKAERLLRDATVALEASLGPEHPELARTLHDYAFICERTNNLGDAEESYRRAHAIAVKTLSPRDPFVATSVKGLLTFCTTHAIPIWKPPASASSSVSVQRSPAAVNDLDVFASEADASKVEQKPDVAERINLAEQNSPAEDIRLAEQRHTATADATPVETPIETAPIESAPIDTAPIEMAPIETLRALSAATFKTAAFESPSSEPDPVDTPAFETAAFETAPPAADPFVGAPFETASSTPPPFEDAPLTAAPPQAAAFEPRFFDAAPLESAPPPAAPLASAPLADVTFEAAPFEGTMLKRGQFEAAPIAATPDRYAGLDPVIPTAMGVAAPGRVVRTSRDVAGRAIALLIGAAIVVAAILFAVRWTRTSVPEVATNPPAIAQPTTTPAAPTPIQELSAPAEAPAAAPAAPPLTPPAAPARSNPTRVQPREAAPKAVAPPARPTRATTPAVTVLNARLCRTITKQGSPDWKCTPAEGDLRPGNYFFYTRLLATSNTKVEHRWYLDGRQQKVIPLSITASPGVGYRTISSTNISADRPGNWRVEVRAADGTVLQEHAFVITSR